MQGSDLWWHLAAGRWMVESRSFALVDPFSFTREGQPWLQAEWLAALIYHFWASLFGLASLAYWKWLLIVGTFALLFRTLCQITKDPISSYLSTLFAIAVAAPFLDVRPHLYSLLACVLLLRLTLTRARPSWLLPLLFLIWVNLHPGFFFGLLALAVLLLPSALADPRARQRAVLIWVACLLVSLINPNGLGVFTYPLEYAFDTASPFRTLGEWLPPFEPHGIQAPLYPYVIGLFLGAGLAVVLSRSFRAQWGVPWPGLALGALTLAMSLRSRRFITVFGISQSLLVAPVLAHFLRPSVRRIPRLVAPLLATVTGVVWLARYPVTPYAFHYLTTEDAFPVETCNFIEANQLAGKVFAYYNWGGYLHLRTQGRMKVFIDGRANTVYDPDTYLRYVAVLGLRPGWIDVIDSSGAEYVLWPRSRAAHVSQLIGSGRWRVVYRDAVSTLLAKVGSPLPTPHRPTSDSAYRQLALGVDRWEERRLAEAEKHFRRALETMPHLRTACYYLARVQALQGLVDAGWRTMEHCQRVYPNREQIEDFRDFLRRVRPAGR